MKLIKRTSAILITAALLSVQTAGHAVPFSVADHEETRGYIGLQWFTGETSLTKPNLVLGVRKTTTAASDNRVTGPDLTLTYSLEKSQFDAIRIGYLNGKCNFLATAGLGYSFKKSVVLGFVGAVGPFSKMFGELDSNLGVGAGLELNTQKCAGDADTAVVPG